MEDDSRVCVCVCRMNTHRQMQIGTKSWNNTAHKDERTHFLRVLCVLPSETAELPLQFHGGSLKRHTHRNTLTTLSGTLSQQQKEGKRKESVLSEINRDNPLN